MSQERNKEPVCDVKVNWVRLGVALATPVAGKIRVSGSAQAPSVPLNFSPSVVLRTPALICDQRATGACLDALVVRIYLRLLDRTATKRLLLEEKLSGLS